MAQIIRNNKSFDVVILGDATTGDPYNAGGGGGGGGGPVSIADGADVTQGAKADAMAATDTGTATAMAIWKRIAFKLPLVGPALKAASMPVTIATDQGSIPVTFGNPTSFVTGQAKIVTTGTAVQLPSNALANGLIVKSLSSNNIAKQTIGPSTVTNVVDGTGNGYIIQPGEAGSFGVTNSNTIYVNGTAGDIFTFEGS